MDSVKSSSSQLDGLIPYDPKYLPAKYIMSANENPLDVPLDVRLEIEQAIRDVAFNRYPDPLANELRDMIAEANGLSREWVLLGNGGDQLLFDTAMAWGGPGRTFLNLPPTFSVYAANARLTNTEVVDIERIQNRNWAIDEEAVLAALADQAKPIDFVIIGSPNNPTGELADARFVERVLESTDALVMVDEAYFEFSRSSVLPYLERHKNLVILRTFSKAYSLAGVRIGYILAHPAVITEYIKVRQPYSVDAVSQAIAKTVYRNRAAFEDRVDAIISERDRVTDALCDIPGIKAYPSDSNWILFAIDNASAAWEYLYSQGVLVRDFSASAGIEGTLRVSIGTKEQNDAFLQAIRDFAINNA